MGVPRVLAMCLFGWAMVAASQGDITTLTALVIACTTGGFVGYEPSEGDW